MHGEQGALIATARSCRPCGSRLEILCPTQVMDEARHSKPIAALHEKFERAYPITPV